MKKAAIKKNFIVDAAVAAAHRRGLSVAQSCQLAGTSRSSFYRRAGTPGKRVLEDQTLGERIRALHEQHEGRYGIRRMTAALRWSCAQAGAQSGCPHHAGAGMLGENPTCEQ